MNLKPNDLRPLEAAIRKQEKEIFEIQKQSFLTEAQKSRQILNRRAVINACRRLLNAHEIKEEASCASA